MAISALESNLDRVRAVVVQGDTNSALAGGLTANALSKSLFHVEAGLRSYDRRMPEEHNRVLLDHLADVCWAPTAGNQQNLLAEGIEGGRIEVTGNTIVESLRHLLPEPEARSATLARLGLVSQQFVLATIHRPENVDDPVQLRAIVEALGEIPMPVYLPAHPRTIAQIEATSSISVGSSITIVPPLGYRDFLSLLAECGLAISDSGGVQEEVSLLKIPLIVLRRSTERPEVIGTFATLLSDPVEVVRDARRLIECLDERRAEIRGLETPFGDGHSAQRMADSLVRHLTEWSR
jgi:UDP-N-acetylglucosamine 2-epimerase (non-hydrolysing)